VVVCAKAGAVASAARLAAIRSERVFIVVFLP
jgi:hypothetical protein